jgi:hypothetical protein
VILNILETTSLSYILLGHLGKKLYGKLPCNTKCYKSRLYFY